MKFLHTSDWHLGQKFQHRDRQEEHALFLNWLLECLDKEKIDVLLLSGDVFDTSNPPNYAQKLYYEFLTKAQATCCRQVIVIGGNHDSPSQLNAPAELLRLLNVSVIGACGESLDDEIIELRKPDGSLGAVVAAVPFLRDRDLRKAVPGENFEEKHEQLKAGIKTHYEAVADRIQSRYEGTGVPFLATGHLFAAGAAASAPDENKQDNIYIGNMENIRADHFPELFDYIALGHIHKPQKIGGLEHIRYSGSPIPLDFGERKDKKIVLTVEFDPENKVSVQEIEVPVSRSLKRFQGDKEEILEKLETYENPGGLTAWLELIVKSDSYLPNVDMALQEAVEGKNAEIMRIKRKGVARVLEHTEQVDLQELKVEEVFDKKIGENLEGEARERLMLTFKELLSWMEESKE